MWLMALMLVYVVDQSNHDRRRSYGLAGRHVVSSLQAVIVISGHVCLESTTTDGSGDDDTEVVDTENGDGDDDNESLPVGKIFDGLS